MHSVSPEYQLEPLRLRQVCIVSIQIQWIKSNHKIHHFRSHTLLGPLGAPFPAPGPHFPHPFGGRLASAIYGSARVDPGRSHALTVGPGPWALRGARSAIYSCMQCGPARSALYACLLLMVPTVRSYGNASYGNASYGNTSTAMHPWQCIHGNAHLCSG